MPTQDRNKSNQGSNQGKSDQMNQGDRSKQQASSTDRSNPSSLSGKDTDRSNDLSGSSSRSGQDRNH